MATLASTPVSDAIRRVTIGEPRTWGGLTVFPLLREGGRPPGYDMFGAAAAAGSLEITEVSGSGVVARIRAVNLGSRPVLLLDGEEVVGAKQNRIINLTVMVAAGSVLDLPVSCVEQGRWRMQSRAFRDSGRTMYARGRARKARDVTRSLRTRGVAHTDQAAVWRDVAETLHATGAASPTAAMAAAYERRSIDTEACVAAFEPLPAQVGAVFAVDGRLTGVELFDAHDAWRASSPKILRGYAVELRDATSAGPRAPIPPDDVQRFLEELMTVPASVHEAVGAGLQYRFDDDRITGAALAHDNTAVHVMAFRIADDDGGSSGGADRTGVALHLIRSGLMRCVPGATFTRQPQRPSGDAARLRDRVEGMLLGLAIGDALGNTTEGMTAAQRGARFGTVRDYLPNDYADGREAGMPSDDTQLAFRTLRRLLADGRLDVDRLAADFSRERIFGIGHTVRAFIRAYKDEGRPWTEAGQRSAGNGALMRIAPVLLPHLRSPSPGLWDDAAVAGMITHNDPASIASCVAFVDLLWRLLDMDAPPERGWWLRTFVATLRDVEGDATTYRPRTSHVRHAGPLWAFTERHVGSALELDLDTLDACDTWHSGAYLLETVPSVIYILERHGHDPEEAIVRAVNDTKDNDTIAAIVGAAAGALHGRSALPRRWQNGLLGRIAANDDGTVFRLVEAAGEAFIGSRRDDLQPS